MIIEELVNLTPSAIMEFFELNIRELPTFDENDPLPIEESVSLDQRGIYRFYAWGLNELEDSVVWQGNTYQPFPIQVSGFSLEGEKQVPRPTMSISNLGYLVQELVNKHADILGGKVTRKRTFAKFLDAVNFELGNPTADPTLEFPDTIYYIRKKQAENVETMVFELSSPWDVEGIRLPRRIMNSDVCPWVYRGGTCRYSDDRYFNIKDEYLGNAADGIDASEDVCGKRLTSCLARFNEDYMLSTRTADAKGNKVADWKKPAPSTRLSIEDILGIDGYDEIPEWVQDTYPTYLPAIPFGGFPALGSD